MYRIWFGGMLTIAIVTVIAILMHVSSLLSLEDIMEARVEKADAVGGCNFCRKETITVLEMTGNGVRIRMCRECTNKVVKEASRWVR